MKMKAKFWMSLFALIAMGCQPIYAIETSGEIGSQDAGVLQLVEQLENADGRYYAAGIISSYYTSTHNVIYVAFDENLYNLIKSYS